MLLRWWRRLLAWEGRKLRRISPSLALFLPVRTTQGLSRIGDIDVDLNPEEGVTAREECPLFRVEEVRTRAVGYLGCEGGPHLHELVTGRRGGEAKLSLPVEVEISDKMEACIPAGWALWWDDGGHG